MLNSFSEDLLIRHFKDETIKIVIYSWTIREHSEQFGHYLKKKVRIDFLNYWFEEIDQDFGLLNREFYLEIMNID